jgi:hypothetical protein
MARKSKQYRLFPDQEFLICPKFPVPPGLKRSSLRGLSVKKRIAKTGIKNPHREFWIKIFPGCPAGYREYRHAAPTVE